jgi:hypothetical protein
MKKKKKAGVWQKEKLHFFLGAKDQTQGFTYYRQVLYH